MCYIKSGELARREYRAEYITVNISNMDILENKGIKIPNAVLIKYATQDVIDDEVVAFVMQYGKASNIAVITEPGVFQDTIVIEFESGDALVELRKLLPYTYTCETQGVTYEILELAPICTDSFGELKTRKYLGELKELATLTGRDYAEVLKGLMSLLGQSITEERLDPKVETHPDSREEVMQGAPSNAVPLPNTAISSPLHGTMAKIHKFSDELPHIPSTSSSQGAARPSFPTMSLPDLNPPGIQRYVVEHIVKSDDSAAHLSTPRLRSFSGRVPRPQNESDYEAWRSGVELLLKDPAVSDLQRSRRILESLLLPAADMVRHLMPDTPPMVFLQILDSAYGTVQDGDELYAKFLELFQDAGENPSAYLQRLQVALSLTAKRGGVPAAELDRHLLNQFCRGCWDNTLISELQLKQRKSRPPSFAELLLLLRTEEDRGAAKVQRMKQHLGTKTRAGAHAQYASAAPEEDKMNALTAITQQLTQQLADIQKQLAALTAQSNRKQPTSSSSTRVSRPSESMRSSKAPPRSSHKTPPPWPKPGYCYNCGEDGHIRPNCDNDPNPALVAMKKKEFAERQKKWSRSNPHGASSLN